MGQQEIDTEGRGAPKVRGQHAGKGKTRPNAREHTNNRQQLLKDPVNIASSDDPYPRPSRDLIFKPFGLTACNGNASTSGRLVPCGRLGLPGGSASGLGLGLGAGRWLRRRAARRNVFNALLWAQANHLPGTFCNPCQGRSTGLQGLFAQLFWDVSSRPASRHPPSLFGALLQHVSRTISGPLQLSRTRVLQAIFLASAS